MYPIRTGTSLNTALVPDVIDHPFATRKSVGLARLQVENGRSCMLNSAARVKPGHAASAARP
jgi:hypothetical protein